MMKYGLFLLFIFLSCKETRKFPQADVQKNAVRPVIPENVIRYGDSSLHVENGIWYKDMEPYSGMIETYFPDGLLQARQTFYQGKEEGLRNTYYANGYPESVRYYRGGEKDSVHRGWWPNGQLRYEYHFQMGVYEGDWKEWYASGVLMKHIIYQNGKEQSGRGWRENGKPYMSFVSRDGRLYGLINANLCYSLRNEKGAFTSSTDIK
jgi:antitoxin component YwqK of YwqJK toxin-antitoxin module